MGRSPLILVADGDAQYRAQVKSLLERIGCSTVEAIDGQQAVEVAHREQPALVLLDVNLSGVSGYEVCRELRDTFHREIGVIFVSGDRTESYDRVAGLLVGADDYVVKPFDDGELLARIRRLLRHAASGSGPNGTHSGAPFSSLTTREREVLNLLARGYTQSDIAGMLDISPKTVGTHIQRILNKLNVHSRAQAVAFAHEQGLANGDSRPFADVESHVFAAWLDAL